MRSLAVAAVLLCVIAIYVFSSTVYLSGFFHGFLTEIDSLPESPDGCEDEAGRVFLEWERGRAAVIILTDRTEADRIADAVQRLIASASSGDEKEYTAAVKQLRYETEQMIRYISPSFYNVF